MTDAESRLASGTGDLSLKARLLQYMASLYNHEGKYGDAIALAQESGGISQDIGETLLLGQALIIESMAHLYGGDPECAIKPLRKALRSIDPVKDPELLFAAYHNLANCYLDLNNPEEVLTIRRQLRNLRIQPKYATILSRAAWQEGRLLRSQGCLEAAAAALIRAREGFTELKLPLEIAILSQDLVGIYAELEQRQELDQTIVDTRSLLRDLHAGPEAQIALERLTSKDQR